MILIISHIDARWDPSSPRWIKERWYAGVRWIEKNWGHSDKIQRALQFFYCGDLWFHLAKVLEDSGNLEEAIKSYRQIITVVPKTGAVYTALGQLYERREQLDKAEETYKQGIVAAPTDGPLRIMLGQLYERQGS